MMMWQPECLTTVETTAVRTMRKRIRRSMKRVRRTKRRKSSTLFWPLSISGNAIHRRGEKCRETMASNMMIRTIRLMKMRIAKRTVIGGQAMGRLEAAAVRCIPWGAFPLEDQVGALIGEEVGDGQAEAGGLMASLGEVGRVGGHLEVSQAEEKLVGEVEEVSLGAAATEGEEEVEIAKVAGVGAVVDGWLRDGERLSLLGRRNGPGLKADVSARRRHEGTSRNLDLGYKI